MRRGVAIAGAIAALLVCSAPAQAGKVLSFAKARAATTEEAHRACKAEPGCDESGVGTCRRQAIRRIRCIAIIRDDAADSAGPCRWSVLVRLRIDGSASAESGPRDCATMLPSR
ncbi:MAG TPA: hypothetical protein VFY99_03400 [Solirubrobacterales bacterium]